jgi:hypothetical protein
MYKNLAILFNAQHVKNKYVTPAIIKYNFKPVHSVNNIINYFKIMYHLIYLIILFKIGQVIINIGILTRIILMRIK